MEEAMHREMGHMMEQGFSFGSGFARADTVGNHDVAKHSWRASFLTCGMAGKGEHVGWLVATAPSVVQGTDRVVIGEHNRDFGVIEVFGPGGIECAAQGW